ncbi:DNA internalization-related competence protein ComEC/Rec2 [Trichlorobacter thiogenes]|uniref:DNA internalization-related competence protein ComEC/Rec2 n=1 Tax=Trichlorobacter thiogenes TaxID=115783 RepID=UPI001FCA1C1E|nr:DNA internalization-related competence protein ComEC/Rec2 [Trichlorobacter thiogenes]
MPFKSQVLFGWLLALFWMSWGMAALAPHLDKNLAGQGIAAFDGKQVVVEGILQGRPLMKAEGQRFELQVEQVYSNGTTFAVDGVLLVTIAKGQGPWLSGDRIRCPAKVHLPRLLGLPGEFDYRRYLALRGVQATAWVHEADSIVLMRGAAVTSWHRWIDALALRSQEFIRKNVPDPDQRGIVLALATGGQQEVSPAITTAYSRAGVSHILSVSGFHVGVVVAVWVLCLRWLMLRWEWLALRIDVRRTALLSALPLMLLYLVFTGGAPATARSVLMLSAVVLAIWSEREIDSLDALQLAAFCLLVADPGVLFDLSFQLSFLALWGLLVLTPLLVAPFDRFIVRGWQRTLLLLCAASIATVLSTMAPVLDSFHQVSFSGILANLVIVPLLGYGATVLATAALPLQFWLPSVAAFLLKVSGWLVLVSNGFIFWISRLPVLHSFNVGPVDLLATVVLLGLLSFIRSGRSKAVAVSLLVIGLMLVHLWPDAAPDGNMRIAFLGVGQGDATLIKLADGRTLLVDGGGYLLDSNKDFGERYLVPALHRLKVKQIDLMVLTHPHPDHLGGLPAVAEQFRVREFWQGESVGSNDNYQRLIGALNNQHTTLRIVKKGDRVQFGKELVLSVVAPQAVAGGEGGDNDDSLVLHLQQSSFSTLLMGDAGFPVEDMLLRDGVGEITLLKVGHHGSRYASSEQFLARVKPRVAVISVGAGNTFGLPTEETINRIKQQGTELYRTDQQGTIQVETNGIGFTVAPLKTEPALLATVRHFVCNILF